MPESKSGALGQLGDTPVREYFNQSASPRADASPFRSLRAPPNLRETTPRGRRRPSVRAARRRRRSQSRSFGDPAPPTRTSSWRAGPLPKRPRPRARGRCDPAVRARFSGPGLKRTLLCGKACPLSSWAPQIFPRSGRAPQAMRRGTARPGDQTAGAFRRTLPRRPSGRR